MFAPLIGLKWAEGGRQSNGIKAHQRRPDGVNDYLENYEGALNRRGATRLHDRTMI